MRFLFLLLAFWLNSCKTIESILNPLYLTAGFENSSVLFYSRETRGNALIADLLPEISTDNNPVQYRTHNFSSSERGFLTLGSLPQRPWKDIPWMRYFAYKFQIESPRLFRGTLLHYPDVGFSTRDVSLDYFLQVLGPNPSYSRRTEYMYYDTRAFATLYAGYFDNPQWFWGLGFGIGVSQYSLQLIENQREISDVRNQYRNIYNSSLIFGYYLGNLFSHSILADTHAFLELTNEFLFQNPVKVNTNPIFAASANYPLNPDSLYLSLQYFRIGIIKEVNLVSRASP